MPIAIVTAENYEVIHPAPSNSQEGWITAHMSCAREEGSAKHDQAVASKLELHGLPLQTWVLAPLWQAD